MELTPSTVTQALATAAAQGLALDAQWLLLHALGKSPSDRAWLLAHDSDALPDAALSHFTALVQRRALGEPLAYILGRQEFYGLDLAVDARVLVPRPDTETLVDWALAVLDTALPDPTGPGHGHDVLDLGTGSGAVALAIKHARPAAQVSATDFSHDALAVAQANAQRLALDVAFHHGAWLSGITNRYHLIVSNPPYIASHDAHLAALAHEPLQALVSGVDGLDDIRTLIRQAPGCLHPGGWLLLEHGYDQAAAVRALLRQTGFEGMESRRDLPGIERCSGGLWPGKVS